LADAPYGLSGSAFACHCSSFFSSSSQSGVLTELLWKFFGPPNFPFFLMLGIFLGFALAVIVYRKLLRFLA
jgi:hypothetical protein